MASNRRTFWARPRPGDRATSIGLAIPALVALCCILGCRRGSAAADSSGAFSDAQAGAEAASRATKPAHRPSGADSSGHLVLASLHYQALSSADSATTVEALARAETLHASYTRLFAPGHRPEGGKLILRIYGSRREMRAALGMTSWAEAFYRDSICFQAIDTTQKNPYHWMIHEATHQLNHEVAGLLLPKWGSEGLATLFSTSRLHGDSLELGSLDPHTYPIWWIAGLELTGDRARDRAAFRIMSLGDLLAGRQPLPMELYFNLYYIHWFSLVHFLHADAPAAFPGLVRAGFPIDSLARRYTSTERLETLWYRHLQGLVAEARRLGARR